MPRDWNLTLTEEQAQILGYALSTAKRHHREKVKSFKDRMEDGCTTALREVFHNACEKHLDVIRVIQAIEEELDTCPQTEI